MRLSEIELGVIVFGAFFFGRLTAGGGSSPTPTTGAVADTVSNGGNPMGIITIFVFIALIVWVLHKLGVFKALQNERTAK